MSLFCGVFLGAASIFGFGIADTTLIAADRDGGWASLVALPFVGLPLLYFFRRVDKRKGITSIQILRVIVILAIMLSAIALLNSLLAW